MRDRRAQRLALFLSVCSRVMTHETRSVASWIHHVNIPPRGFAAKGTSPPALAHMRDTPRSWRRHGAALTPPRPSPCTPRDLSPRVASACWRSLSTDLPQQGGARGASGRILGRCHFATGWARFGRAVTTVLLRRSDSHGEAVDASCGTSAAPAPGGELEIGGAGVGAARTLLTRGSRVQ